MKRIDLHIHTVPTISEAAFAFSLDTFVRYVADAGLDAVAVTNHDVFDREQFAIISEALSAVVFPGIEINVGKGHLLLIDEPTRIDEFARRANEVSRRITKVGDSLSVDELVGIYDDLSRYLVIPHFDKSPAIRGEALEELRPYFRAGEVDSAKKFVRAVKDETKPTPVLFSDSRMRADLSRMPTRQTFIDCGELTLGALKACLEDKGKVALSESDGNQLWPALGAGQQISTGLNVLLGARSSGKTHTLNEISEIVENPKYIRQFSLVQHSEDAYKNDFENDVERRRSAFVDSYLAGLKRVVESVAEVDLDARDREVGRYVDTLLKSADEADRQDAFSRAALFDEVKFSLSSNNTLTSLIEAVRHVIATREFRDTVEKYVDINSLKSLLLELIELLHRRTLQNDKLKLVNDLVDEVRRELRLRTAATQVEDVDLYGGRLDAQRVRRFRDIVGMLRKEAVIFEATLQGFRIEARRGPYAGAGEIKTASGVKVALSDAFREYCDPYKYLRCLLSKEGLMHADLYKLFVKVSYRILNQDGFEVSGGERSEYRLLQEISDAQAHDILLVDEPESSFDNLFLRTNVNQLLKAISRTMPVVVVTHNSTVGASIAPDYILFTKKELESGKVVYRLYSGFPTDKALTSADGLTISNHEIMMDSLEAGAKAYERRRRAYEATKD